MTNFSQLTRLPAMLTPEPMSEIPDILVETRGALGLITLNRPQALNALNGPMVDGMAAALDRFEADPAIRQVAVRGAGGKAFCAGGDIRLMHEYGTTGRQALALDFWAREYRLNARIKAYPKPYIALVDGIVMGGGVGVSLHGSHRLAGPNFLFAMPEVGIGFFPDVGATYALPRLPGASGAWLAVTGARIRRADALHLGLATHAMMAGSEDALLDALAAGAGIDAVALRFSETVSAPPMAATQNEIDRFFGASTLPELIAGLEAGEDDGNIFARETLAGMRGKSPTSMAIALEQIRQGRTLDFNQAMTLEFRIVSRIIEGADFYEGVRALIIDKDNKPVWIPPSLEAVDPEAIARHFAPLPRELVLD